MLIMNVNIYLTAGMSFSTMSSRKFISPSLCSAIQTSRIKTNTTRDFEGGCGAHLERYLPELSGPPV